MRSILILSLLFFTVSSKTRNVQVRGRVTCIEKENGLIYNRKIKGVKIDLWEEDTAGKNNEVKVGSFTDEKGLFHIEGGFDEASFKFLAIESRMINLWWDEHRFYLEIRFPCAEARKCSNEAYRKTCVGQSGQGYYTAAAFNTKPKPSMISIPYRFTYKPTDETTKTFPFDYQLNEDGAAYTPNRPEL